MPVFAEVMRPTPVARVWCRPMRLLYALLYEHGWRPA
jgi:hypothetical protein